MSYPPASWGKNTDRLHPPACYTIRLIGGISYHLCAVWDVIKPLSVLGAEDWFLSNHHYYHHPSLHSHKLTEKGRKTYITFNNKWAKMGCRTHSINQSTNHQTLYRHKWDEILMQMSSSVMLRPWRAIVRFSNVDLFDLWDDLCSHS